MSHSVKILADASDLLECELEDGSGTQELAHGDFPAAALGVTEFVGAPASEYAHLDPTNVVPVDLLTQALDYFHTNRGQFPNQSVISVLDYRRSSQEPRLHVIDMQSGEVWSLRVANGLHSEPVHNGLATRFGNRHGSYLSSLGFARTAETYTGRYGRSLRLDGLSESNSNLRQREIVVHGSHCVSDWTVIQGRNNGSPAVSMALCQKLIGRIKGGSLMLFGIADQG
jgi:hypothetical protein